MNTPHRSTLAFAATFVARLIDMRRCRFHSSARLQSRIGTIVSCVLLMVIMASLGMRSFAQAEEEIAEPQTMPQVEEEISEAQQAEDEISEAQPVPQAEDEISEAAPSAQVEEEAAIEEEPTIVKPARKKPSRSRAGGTYGSHNERVEIGRDVVIGVDEVVRELVVIAGNATIDGTVRGSLVVISGSAKVNGEVRQDLVTVLGTTTLGPNARVGHDVVVVGGPLHAHPRAEIGGQQTIVTLNQVLPDFMWLQNWLAKGLFLARPFPPQVKWVWIVSALFLLVYLALTLMFPRPVQACVARLEEQPVASFLLGILLFVLLGPLLFLLVVSVAGILVIPFLICALIAAALFGKVAVYAYAGQQVGRQIRISENNLPLVLIVGAVLFYLIYMIPVVGFAVWGIVTLVGLGAVLLAAFGSFRREEPPAYIAAHTMPVPLPVGASMPMAGETTPQLALGLPPASDVALLPRVGFWRRFWATALDFILLGLLMPIVESWFVLIWSAYHVAMWTWKGTTIGGIVMSIKIVRVDGQPIDFAVALVRSLSSFFSAFALFIGFFWAGWDRERQAWHDKIAGTVIVRIPKGMSLI